MSINVDRLSDYGIVKKDTKTERTFMEIEKNFRSNVDLPSLYVQELWNRYQQQVPTEKKNNSLNGNIFEAIIITALIKEGILPIYTQANLEFVPNVDYDVVLFPKMPDGKVDVSAPVVLSLKTSLRERYKQADLEGLALKDVYKRGVSYLITLDDTSTIELVNEKIRKKDIRGIDSFINATSNRFDEMINELKEKTVSAPPSIQVIKESKEIGIGRGNENV